jgi:hypothetical protein
VNYTKVDITTPTATFEFVGPEEARRWLAASGGNRPMKGPHISRISRNITEGRWALTGEAIKFDTKDALLDGHHRLHAIIRAEISVPILVVRGLPTESVAQMDAAASRVLADRFFRYTHDDTIKELVADSARRAKLLAASTAYLYHLATGHNWRDLEHPIQIARHYYHHYAFLLDEHATDPLIAQKPVISALVLGLGYAMREGEDRVGAVQSFVKQVSNGEVIEKNDPAYLLRDYLQDLKVPKRGRHRADNANLVFFKTLRALQLELDGSKATRIGLPGKHRKLLAWVTDTDTEVWLEEMAVR